MWVGLWHMERDAVVAEHVGQRLGTIWYNGVYLWVYISGRSGSCASCTGLQATQSGAQSHVGCVLTSFPTLSLHSVLCAACSS